MSIYNTQMFYFSLNLVSIKSNPCPRVRVVAGIGYSTPCDKITFNSNINYL